MLVLAIPDPPSRHANDRIFLNEAYNARMMAGTYELAILAKAIAAHWPLRGVEALPRHAELFQAIQANGAQLLAAQGLGPIFAHAVIPDRIEGAFVVCHRHDRHIDVVRVQDEEGRDEGRDIGLGLVAEHPDRAVMKTEVSYMRLDPWCRIVLHMSGILDEFDVGQTALRELADVQQAEMGAVEKPFDHLHLI